MGVGCRFVDSNGEDASAPPAVSSLEGTSGNPLKTEVASSSYTDMDAENGTMYYYQVTAVRSEKESEPSNEIARRPFSSPPEERP